MFFFSGKKGSVKKRICTLAKQHHLIKGGRRENSISHYLPLPPSFLFPLISLFGGDQSIHLSSSPYSSAKNHTAIPLLYLRSHLRTRMVRKIFTYTNMPFRAHRELFLTYVHYNGFSQNLLWTALKSQEATTFGAATSIQPPSVSQKKKKNPPLSQFLLYEAKQIEAKTAPHDSNSNLGGTVRICERGIGIFPRPNPTAAAPFYFSQFRGFPTLFPSIIFLPIWVLSAAAW